MGLFKLAGVLAKTAAVAAASVLLSSSASAFERNILTGGPTGTYIQIGGDLSGLAAACGIELNVRESAGSLENFLGVRKRRHTQLGIVQSDVLEYLKTYSSEDPEIARAIFGVRIAFPLYNEEVHILAKKDINSLSDLNGRRVGVGVEDSGTFLTSSLVLDLAGVTPSERLTVNADTSLQMLLDGSIDAFFYVAGAPTKIFQTDQIDPEKLHLLPVTDPTLAAVYTPSKIEAGTYPFQQDTIDVVAVKAVLMTYEYTPTRNAYHRQSCKAVSDVAHLIAKEFQTLKQSGHPKWNDVDLNDIPPGWNISECVNLGLGEGYELSCGPVATTEQPSIESEANAAYRNRICAVIGC
ncbi:C4-dicarboxylate ABC transporter substrate-binding protein [Ruegeria sp. ANG-S4]|uniref:TAXI family TRAP transporter solute-binding subunit n=1 Tax=Ruegeria sp. ANG-S4 TaxID=1577904 RepID=UPI00057FC372|nr:TAXI family TRAP transporter solute-binding subunit [Ruegeria sp. ANG-S4]KIC47372.1 C4-dicarboxylate ABC transporter substrate-binding protein [Ruegeria sp. ANG-S4]